MYNYFYFLLLFGLLTSCKEEAEKDVSEILAIRSIGELATSEYTFGKIIELNDDTQWYKFGDRSILISCKACVKSGIDLSKIKTEDIIVSGNNLKLKLPKTKLLSFHMDPKDIKVESVNINGFRTNFTQTEKQHILSLGEKSILKNLEKTNYLKHAEKQVIEFITGFYRNLGFQKIDIEFIN